MKNLDLKGKRTLVVGLGKSGVAASRLLLRNGAIVTATDNNPAEKLSDDARSLMTSGVKIEAGGHLTGSFTSSDLIILSPGVPKEIKPMAAARERGVRIISEIELACRFIDTPLIAITGSNGKSTTTTLIGRILMLNGSSVFVGGNIGTPLCEYVLSGKTADWVVAEISSFQLETIEGFRPRISLLLNISPDHMDRYHDISDYKEAKFRIFENQDKDDFAVINGDEPWCPDLAGRIKCRPVLFSRRNKTANGIFTEDGWIVSDIGGTRLRVCETSALGIRGVHNLENAMASAAAGILAGCSKNAIESALKTFTGLEHRLESVREINGVRYINDSKGTNVGAVIKSIESFDEPLLLIAGGRDKGSDFSPLRPLIKERVKRLILIGEASRKIAKDAAGLTETSFASSLEEAVSMAQGSAVKGDVVLLSPACASFDMFRNFEDRGNKFKEIVWRLNSSA
ncbi:MAG: UDP-N-acetylmuramoyl-L-alanine--D-glutamate ligase [Nitrospirae bacterium]|nr:UDP-N-acetylmuramoyl-L-alanine--D-glutamate ligase [Nitrospirota bacterium]